MKYPIKKETYELIERLRKKRIRDTGYKIHKADFIKQIIRIENGTKKNTITKK